MTARPMVVIESPFKGDGTATDRAKLITYARRALRHSIDLGESPIASHLLYTQVLQDGFLPHRELGMGMVHDWFDRAGTIVFYTDYGMSSGMELGLARAREHGKICFQRTIGPNEAPHHEWSGYRGEDLMFSGVSN